MEATYNGNSIVITFDPQVEQLDAPNGKQYIPCSSNCGRLLVADLNVVSKTCDACFNARIEE